MLQVSSSFDFKKSIKTYYVLQVHPWSHGGQEVLVSQILVSICLELFSKSIQKIIFNSYNSCSSYFISAYRVLLGTELGSGCSSRSSFLKLDVRDLPGMNKQRDKWLEHYQDRISKGFIKYSFIPLY